MVNEDRGQRRRSSPVRHAVTPSLRLRPTIHHPHERSRGLAISECLGATSTEIITDRFHPGFLSWSSKR
jgi:hypothetical protein